MNIGERKQKILGAVVRDYVETVKPVGSEDLATRHAWGIKSATIRSELAELSEMGLLRQPHTSAGRIPSDSGYRFYVDHLMRVRPVDETGMKRDETSDLDRLLRSTCALLTRLTSYTSVATPPRPADTRLTQVFVSPTADGRLLLVALLSTGGVENRLLPDPKDVGGSELVVVGNALNAAFGGKSLDDIIAAAPDVAPAELSAPQRNLFCALALAVRALVQNTVNEDSVYLEGASEILRQPEFRDAGKLESLLDTLQRRTSLFQTLSRALLGPDVTVVIGAENHVPAMHECSVVTASYFIGTRERGTIGVVGPTRMDYDRAVPAVSFFARTLTQTLTRLGR